MIPRSLSWLVTTSSDLTGCFCCCCYCCCCCCLLQCASLIFNDFQLPFCCLFMQLGYVLLMFSQSVLIFTYWINLVSPTNLVDTTADSWPFLNKLNNTVPIKILEKRSHCFLHSLVKRYVSLFALYILFKLTAESWIDSSSYPMNLRFAEEPLGDFARVQNVS